MDQATQQNAALVEEMAAAASSLKSQANDLVQVVGVFKLDQGGSGGFGSAPVLHASPAAVRAAPKAGGVAGSFSGPERRLTGAGAFASSAKNAPAAAKPAAKPLAVAAAPIAPPPKASARVTPAGGDDDWDTF
jgi:hypothetical protein